MVNTIKAAQSTITEADGYACMGDDKSKKQTEQTALADAKRNAAEYALTYIQSETKVKDFQLEKDLIEAYSKASVKLIQEIERKWFKDDSKGDCFKLRIKAEVVPNDEFIQKMEKNKGISEDPSAPLSVQIWTDKNEYRQSEKIKVYLKGKKPFYAMVVYMDATGKLVQLLPNPQRTKNYFNGGVIYEIPSGEDKFELEVSPPFGQEDIIVYASNSPLGEMNLQAEGGIYQVKTKAADMGIKTRGVSLKEKADGKGSLPSEFFEGSLVVRTRK